MRAVRVREVRADVGRPAEGESQYGTKHGNAPAPAPAPVVTAPIAGSLWTDNASSLYMLRQYHVGRYYYCYYHPGFQHRDVRRSQHRQRLGGDGDPTTGMLLGFKGLGINANRSTSGSGSSDTNTVIMDTATVTVTQVLPNGNLEVQGKRQIKLKQDLEALTFTGDIRPADISPETNSVSSTLIANLHLESKGDGPIAEKQRNGWLSRFLSWFW